MTNFNQEIEKIIQEEVNKRCHEEKLKVEFWRETAREREEEKLMLKKELAEIFESHNAIEEEKEYNENLLYLVKGLKLDDILKLLNESTREDYLRAEKVPIWFKILFESKRDNKELIKAMIALGLDIPEQVLEFKNPINYSKEELFDLFSTKTNFYVTNGSLTEHNARFFFDSLRVNGWSFNPNQENLPLQLLLRNPLILDEEIFKMALYVLDDYSLYISQYQELNIEQSITLSKKFKSPHSTEILLKCKEGYKNEYIQNEFMKLDLINRDIFSPQRSIDLLTDNNKVKYLLDKKKDLSLNEVLNVCVKYKFTEKLTKEILNGYLQ